MIKGSLVVALGGTFFEYSKRLLHNIHNYGGAVQLAFISSRIPIDRSLLVHGAFGVVVFYFSLFHRPLRVMDTLLSNVVSDMNDAVFLLLFKLRKIIRPL